MERLAPLVGDLASHGGMQSIVHPRRDGRDWGFHNVLEASSAWNVLLLLKRDPFLRHVGLDCPALNVLLPLLETLFSNLGLCPKHWLRMGACKALYIRDGMEGTGASTTYWKPVQHGTCCCS